MSKIGQTNLHKSDGTENFLLKKMASEKDTKLKTLTAAMVSSNTKKNNHNYKNEKNRLFNALPKRKRTPSPITSTPKLIKQQPIHCGEIFVANNAARQWTFTCSFCRKSTRDIGDFICHIKMKHLVEPLQQTDEDYSGNYYDDDYSDDDTNSQDQHYLDYNSYLDVNVHTEPVEFVPLNQASTSQPPINHRTATHTIVTSVDNNQDIAAMSSVPKENIIVNLVDDDYEVEDVKKDFGNFVDIEKKITAHTSRRPISIKPITSSKNQSKETTAIIYPEKKVVANGKVQENMLNYNSSDEPVHPNLINPTEEKKKKKKNKEADEKYDDDFDNQLLISPEDYKMDDTSKSNKSNTKRRQIRGTAYCSLCKRTFQYYSLYRNHMIKHSNETPFTCSVCYKGFKSKQAIRYHLHTHQRKKYHKCAVCDASFYTHNQLISHILNHENETTFPCMVCGKILHTEKERETHLTTHKEECPYRCDFCPKRFRKRHHLSNHLKRHRHYRCDFCKEKFLSATHLHKPYACKSCLMSETVQQQLHINDTNTAGEISLENSELKTKETIKPEKGVTGVANLDEMETWTVDSDDGNNDDDDNNEDDNNDASNNEQSEIDNSNSLLMVADRPDSFDESSFLKGRFCCKYCNNKYSYRSGLNYHMRTKHS